MTARILVVDDILANRRLLEARLGAEYFDVATAGSGPEALAAARAAPPDLVLLDVMMPGMDGFEVCRALKADPVTAHVPVVMVTALDQVSDRVRGLEAGADDFLTKPVNDVALLARVRSLVRLKMMTDELRVRAGATGLAAGQPAGGAGSMPHDTGLGGRLLVVDDRPSSAERLVAALGHEHAVEVETGPQEALFRLAEGAYDVVLVSLGLTGHDALRLCGQIRSLERTRPLPILLLAEPDEQARVLRGLEIGVNDYLVRPLDRNELSARVRTQVRRRRYAEHLRQSVQHSIEAAVTDALTGLHNRRFFETQGAAALERAARQGEPLALLVVDIDHFKSINDRHGHDAGDDVLRELSHRLRRNLRGIDLPCRLGGEEFVVVMPETSMTVAMLVAERVRQKIARDPFRVHSGAGSLSVTVSVGAASRQGPDDTLQTIFKRADEALYRAKHEGRNRVVADAA